MRYFDPLVNVDPPSMSEPPSAVLRDEPYAATLKMIPEESSPTMIEVRSSMNSLRS
jgi:hypothetical protein